MVLVGVIFSLRYNIKL